MAPHQSSKAHHHVAQHYLRRFCVGGSEELYVHRRDWPAAKLLHTKVTAQQTKLYSFDQPKAGLPVDIVERALNEEVDAPSSAILPRLAAGHALSLDERLIFARHIALQSLRTPWARSQFRRSSEFLHFETFRAFLESALKDPAQASERLGRPLHSQDLATALEALTSGGVSISIRNDGWRDILMRFLVDPELPPIIASLPWVIVRSHTGHFVTSDNPVVKARIRSRRLGERRAGWESPSIETTYTLSPDTILVIRADLSEGLSTASNTWRKSVNRRCVLYANEEFYASSELPGLHRVLRESQPLSIQTRTITTPDGRELLHTAEPYVTGVPFS